MSHTFTYHTVANTRCPDTPVDCMFLDRWSPRAFSEEPIAQEQLNMMFEAARWAPSCYNDQPWLFVFAREPEAREAFISTLVEQNREWAKRAPVLLFVLAHRNFARNGRPNRHAAFDAGAAWMSLALQARRIGLYTHAMAGFDVNAAHKVLKTSDKEYDILAAVAIGRLGDPSVLPESLQAVESPNDRKPLSLVVEEFTTAHLKDQ